jgi:hypothetical protein
MSGWTSPGGDPVPPGGQQRPSGPPPHQPPQHPPPAPGRYQAGPWGDVPGYGQGGARPPRPGIVPLRPLGLGEIYDGAFQAVRTNPSAMVGAAAVVVVVMTALQLVLQTWMTGSLTPLLEMSTATSPEDVPDTGVVLDAIGATSVALLATQAVSVIALAVLTAIAIVVVGGAVLGRRTAGAELWNRVRGRLLPLIGLTVLVGLLTAAAVLACFVPAVLAFFVSDALAVLLVLLGLVAALAAGLFVDTRFALAGPALVLEEQKVGAALGRSWRLTSRGFWRLLGIRVLTFVIVMVTTAIVSAPFQVVAVVVGGSDPFGAIAPSLPQLLLTGLGSAVAATIVYPFAAAVTALLYVDQRMRLEGLDVELARAAAA